jgi:hypothetical protein
MFRKTKTILSSEWHPNSARECSLLPLFHVEFIVINIIDLLPNRYNDSSSVKSARFQKIS